MGVVEHAITDRIGDSSVANLIVPVLDRQLAGEDGRARGVPILNDLQDVAPILVPKRGQSPVIQDHQVGSGEAGQEPGIGPVGVGEGELLDQARDAAVEDPSARATGLVGEGTGDEGLPRPGARVSGSGPW